MAPAIHILCCSLPGIALCCNLYLKVKGLFLPKKRSKLQNNHLNSLYKQIEKHWNIFSQQLCLFLFHRLKMRPGKDTSLVSLYPSFQLQEHLQIQKARASYHIYPKNITLSIFRNMLRRKMCFKSPEDYI